MKDILFYQNYHAAGDVITIVLCIMIWFLTHSVYVVKKINLNVFNAGNTLILTSAISSVVYHELILVLTPQRVIWVYLFRSVMYITLIWTLVCYCIYIRNLVEMSPIYKKISHFTFEGVALFFSLWICFSPITKRGFYIDENLGIHQNYYQEPFRFAYVYYMLSLVTLVIIYHRMFITKMIKCIVSVMVMSFLLMALQDQYMVTTFVCVSFVIPMIALLFLFHYNSYDIDTGTLDHNAFDAYIRDYHNKKFSMIFLSLPDITQKTLGELSSDFFHLNDRFLAYSCSFRLRDNRMVMIYQKEKNKNVDLILAGLFRDFKQMYQKNKIDFRIVLMDSTQKLAYGEDYLFLCEYMEKDMQINTVKTCLEEDVQTYLRIKQITNILKDIYLKDDLNDERVKVYCQPVLNTKTNTFTTAEALMRLEVPELGLIYPDQFIPLAEKYGYIHVLSKIILNKTCHYIRWLQWHGYYIERVSVNFSIMELQLEHFCDDIVGIIQANKTPFDKIALELTESRNEKDFNNVKRIMENLQGLGIKFYLDDFGTGYSNFERIIGLPIDIIKFDRSLTILAGKDDESKFMVGSFSEIFKKADYQILFEGIEDEKDELQCIKMDALYLQGYKYSKPIPLEQLEQFLGKVS